MCLCNNIDFGSYANQVSMRNPFTEKWVCIDVCLATEIGWLWINGINTIESCCGHGKNSGYIAVEYKDYIRVTGLEYKNLSQKDREGDNRQFFYPKGATK
jgi:hypothetical protein